MPEDPQEVAVQKLRDAVQPILHSNYDRGYNLARWLQSNDFNHDKTVHMLSKHLKWRNERALDAPGDNKLQRCKISSEFAPLSIIGWNREDGDRLLVVDQSGCVDIGGVMKAVQPTEYLHNMFRNFEKIRRIITEREELLGRQCYAQYIFDLDGLSFDPFLLSVINGPFKVSWLLSAAQFREWIDKFIVVNAPGYINVLWSAVSAFIPEQAKHRVIIPSSSHCMQVLGDMCDQDYLPVKYGGTMKDEAVFEYPKPVPKELYWTPRSDYPQPAELHKIHIPAGKHRSLIYHLPADTTIEIFSMNDADVTYTFHWAPKQDTPEDELELVQPQILRNPVPAMDRYDQYCEKAGYYQIRLTNDAWLMGTTFRMIVTDLSRNELTALNQKEKWVKAGSKYTPRK